MDQYPKVRKVHALPDKKLRVLFDNREVRLYDCKPLLDQPPFACLRDEAFFRNVHADASGYGISWNDKTDLAESELWVHGAPEDAAASNHA